MKAMRWTAGLALLTATSASSLLTRHVPAAAAPPADAGWGSLAGVPPAAAVLETCVSFRRAATCDATGPRHALGDLPCSAQVPLDVAGFCECAGSRLAGAVGCGHDVAYTCQDVCDGVKAPRTLAAGEAAPAGPHVHSQTAVEQGAVVVEAVSKLVDAAKKGTAVSGAGEEVKWQDLQAAGETASKLGQQLQEMARKSRPYVV